MAKLECPIGCKYPEFAFRTTSEIETHIEDYHKIIANWRSVLQVKFERKNSLIWMGKQA